jgi:peptidoglycan hydrolase CwlO-like protein
MSHKRRHLLVSRDMLQVTLRRARASYEYRQQLLHDTHRHVGKLQHQLSDLQQQLNTVKNQLGS